MIQVLDYTKKPLEKIGITAGTCWGSKIDNPELNRKRAIECIENGHGRVTEYATVDLVIDEYSARVIREWYTSKIGTTNLQESTRYVNMNDFKFFTPDKIKNNEEASNTYQECMENIRTGYMKLIELGVPKEDAANVLPLGSSTKIVCHINLRALMHMAEIRECTRAYHEYRKLMRELKQALSELDGDWKYICDNLLKPKCEVLGYCNERYSCGRKPKKVEEIS